ncbi:hypothetical protein [Christensenella hongkongensis]|uniref:hypothetical protein n=1 Tax=Christensenella hongkongensis TaxID=270498 RepID=UPI00267344AD|nr:hypothetical protein [Christensenella hongkongensis]
MDHSAIKKEDRRVTVTYILCIAALVLYALLLSCEIRTMLPSEIDMDIFNYSLCYFIGFSVQYGAFLALYICLIVNPRQNRTKIVSLAFCISSAVYFVAFCISLIPYILMNWPDLSFMFCILRMLDLILYIILIILSRLLYKKVTKKSYSLLFCRILLFLFLTIWAVRMVVGTVSFTDLTIMDWYTLLKFVEVFMIFLPFYITYKALTDEKFYQRFIVQFPQKPYHPQKLDIFSDK